MKLSTISLLAALALIHGCNGEDESRVVTGAGADDPVIDALFTRWDQPGSPGCAVAVSRDGVLLYSRGYGYANLDYGIPITPQTVFDVASVTKQFVAASLSMLALEGELSFEDDVRKWLPELPESDSPITLRHMVYHTSGLRDYLNLFPLAGRDDYYPISHQQILDMMARQRALNFPPGEKYQYSNTAYMLLAIVVERISGRSLGDYVQERIFDPLQMTGSLMYDDFQRIIPGRATGYVRDDNGQVRMVHNYNFDVPGDGQMYTTVLDLLRWDNYLHGEKKPEFYPVIMLEGTLNSGVHIERAKGLFLDEYRGLRTVHHTGSSWGFRTVVKRFVDADLAVAIACNDDNSNPRGLAFQIADHYLEDQLAPRDRSDDDSSQTDAATGPEVPSPLPGQLDEYSGVFYSAELDATYRFDAVDGTLVVRIEQNTPLNLAPVAVNHFEFEFHPDGWSTAETVHLEFNRDSAGAISGLVLSAGSERDIQFRKRQ